MNVKQMKELLADLPDEMDVFIRCTSGDIGSNITAADSVDKTTYGFFGISIPCVIIEPIEDFIRNRRNQNGQ